MAPLPARLRAMPRKVRTAWQHPGATLLAAVRSCCYLVHGASQFTLAAGGEAEALDLRVLKYSNLGGHGPSRHVPEEMRYSDVLNLNGTKVDMVVACDSEYTPGDPHANGRHWNPVAEGAGCAFGTVSLKAGTEVALRLKFLLHGTPTAIMVPRFYFTVFDMDHGLGSEQIEIAGFSKVFLSHDTKLQYLRGSHGGVLFKPTGSESAKEPTDPAWLSARQRRHAATFVFEDTSNFCLNVSCPRLHADPGCTLLFGSAGHSSMYGKTIHKKSLLRMGVIGHNVASPAIRTLGYSGPSTQTPTSTTFARHHIGRNHTHNVANQTTTRPTIGTADVDNPSVLHHSDSTTTGESTLQLETSLAADGCFDSGNASIPKEKAAYCCQHHGKACDTSLLNAPILGAGAVVADVAEKRYDCMHELSSWKTRWGLWKKLWCCHNEEIGCYDCSGPVSSWTDDHREWCCKAEPSRCQLSSAPTPPTLPEQLAVPGPTVARAGKAELAQAPAAGALAATTRHFDCSSSLLKWRTEWSFEKKAWCCQHEVLGCYDCSRVDMAWTQDHRNWCCRSYGRGCTSTPSPLTSLIWVQDLYVGRQKVVRQADHFLDGRWLAVGPILAAVVFWIRRTSNAIEGLPQRRRSYDRLDGNDQNAASVRILE